MDISNNKLFSALKNIGVDVEGTISRFADNDELYMKFLIRYPEEDKCAPIWEAFSNRDYSSLSKAAHKLKGVSINLGMTTLAEKAEKVEIKAKNMNTDGLEADVHAVFTEYDVLCCIITENAEEAQTV